MRSRYHTFEGQYEYLFKSRGRQTLQLDYFSNLLGLVLENENYF